MVGWVSPIGYFYYLLAQTRLGWSSGDAPFEIIFGKNTPTFLDPHSNALFNASICPKTSSKRSKAVLLRLHRSWPLLLRRPYHASLFDLVTPAAGPSLQLSQRRHCVYRYVDSCPEPPTLPLPVHTIPSLFL